MNICHMPTSDLCETVHNNDAVMNICHMPTSDLCQTKDGLVGNHCCAPSDSTGACWCAPSDSRHKLMCTFWRHRRKLLCTFWQHRRMLMCTFWQHRRKLLGISKQHRRMLMCTFWRHRRKLLCISKQHRHKLPAWTRFVMWLICWNISVLGCTIWTFVWPSKSRLGHTQAPQSDTKFPWSSYCTESSWSHRVCLVRVL